MARAGADITGVIGASGTGKSQYVKRRLRSQRVAGLTMVWSPLESRDRYAAFIDGRVVTSVRALLEAINAGDTRLVYSPDEKRVRLDFQFDLFCRFAWSCGDRGPVRVLVEELSHVTRASYAPPAWSKLSTAGSHHQQIELIATAQRPSMIDKNFLGNCTDIRCFRLNYGTDARSMADMLDVPWRTLKNLPNLHYIHRSIPERKNSAGVQKILTA